MDCKECPKLMSSVTLLHSKVDDLTVSMNRVFDPETGTIVKHAARLTEVEGSINRVKSLILWAFPTGGVLLGFCWVLLKRLGVV